MIWHVIWGCDFPHQITEIIVFDFFFFLSFSIYDYGIHLSNKTYVFWFFNFSFFVLSNADFYSHLGLFYMLCSVLIWPCSMLCYVLIWPCFCVVLSAHLAVFCVVLCGHLIVYCVVLCAHMVVFCVVLCAHLAVFCVVLCGHLIVYCVVLCAHMAVFCVVLCVHLAVFCVVLCFRLLLGRILCCALCSYDRFFILCSVKSETLSIYNVQPRINIFFQRGGRRGWGVRLGWRDNGPGVGRELKWTFLIVYVLNMYKHDKQTSI